MSQASRCRPIRSCSTLAPTTDRDAEKFTMLMTKDESAAESTKIEAVGGRVSIHRRKNSRYWQCQCTINGKTHRVSSRTRDLSEAQRFATVWYLQLSDENVGGLLVPPGDTELPPSEGQFSTALSSATIHGKTDRIVSVAVKLVSEFGFRNTQMNTIAEHSGLALSTLYRHFQSKNELMKALVAKVSGHEVNVAAGAAMTEGNPPSRLELAIRTFALRAIRGRKLAHALVAEPVDAEIETERLRYRRRLMRVYETVIREGMLDGSIGNQDPEVSAGCIVGALFEGLVGPLALQIDLSEEERTERAERIIVFCMRGVMGAPLNHLPAR